MANVDPSSAYAQQNAYLIEYWIDIHDAIDNLDLESFGVLHQGCWPHIWQTFEVQVIHNNDGKIIEEFDEDDLYIGPCKRCLPPSFYIGRDCKVGYFLFACLENGSDILVWLGHTVSNHVLMFGTKIYK